MRASFINALLIFLVLAGTVPFLAAREIPTQAPKRQGFDDQRLNRLTAHMESRVADGTMVGGMGAVVRNGRLVYAQTYGMADRENKIPMGADTIYRIYSMTKPITSVAVMMLFEEGKIALNDPIAKYIPELGNLTVFDHSATLPEVVSDGTITEILDADPESLPEVTLGDASQYKPAARQPTVRDVLTHTAGFTYGVFGNTPVDVAYRRAGLLSPALNLQQFVQRLGQLPLQYEPGTRWHYSVAVDVQGRLVEIVSGMPLDTFLEERIFTPLDMRDTGFFVDPEKRQRLAQIYAPQGIGDQGFFAQPVDNKLEPAPDYVDAGYQEAARFVAGGSGLLSTTRDYLRFCQAILNGGELDGVRILGPKTVELMSGNHLGKLTATYATGSAFGLGFGILVDPAAAGEIGSPGELSWGGAAGTRFWIDPQEQLIGVFMVQSIPHHTRLAREFKTLVYQALVD